MTTIHDTAAVASFSDEKMKKVNLYESRQMFCDVYCLKPGQHQKDHTHGENDKVYHQLTGVCRVRIGQTTCDLKPGMTAIAPAGVLHGVVNASAEPATMLVIMAPHPHFKG